MHNLVRYFLLCLLVLSLSGCELIALGVAAGVTQITAAVEADLARRPVTQQITQTAYVDGAAVQENFRVLDADLRARGYAMVGQPQQTSLEGGAMRDAQLRLQAGNCYAVAAVGDASVQDLAVALTDANGQIVDGDVSSGDHPVVRACIMQTGVYNVRLLMRQGQGNFEYAAYHWTRGTRGPFGVEGLMYVRLAEATALLAARGYEPDPSFTPVKGNLLYVGETQNHRLSLNDGGCVILVAVGGAGVHDLDARLDVGSSQPVQDSDHNAVIALEGCSESHQRAALTLQSSQGAGEYFFQVFRQSGAPSGG